MATSSDWRTLLRSPSFRWLFGARAVSSVGNAIAPVALSFAILDRPGGSATQLGWALAARSGTQVVFLLLGGALADRFPRRHVMAISELTAGIAQLLLASLFIIGHTPLISVLVLCGVNGGAWAAFWPASTGLIPQLVSRQALPAANGLLRFSMNVATVSGAIMAGALTALIGPGYALAVDGFSFVISAVMIAGVRTDRENSSRHDESLLSALSGGWKEFSSRQWVWAIVTQFAVVNACFQGVLLVLGPTVAKRDFDGPVFWSVMLALEATGLAVGSLLAIFRQPRRPLLVATFVTYGFIPVFPALAVRAPVLLIGASMLIWGICASVFNILWNTALQTHIPSRALSRVSSYDAMGSYVLGPAAASVAGPLVASCGIASVLVGCAVVTGIASSAVLLSSQTRHLSSDRGPAV